LKATTSSRAKRGYKKEVLEALLAYYGMDSVTMVKVFKKQNSQIGRTDKEIPDKFRIRR
jgi:hypothetical protein